MALCKAIKNNNYRPCGNKARHGHETCSSHKNFYQKDVWVKRFLYGQADEEILLGYPKDSAAGRLEQHVREVLTSGRFTITYEDVKAIPAIIRFSDIFLILCELPNVIPTWNSRLLISTISWYYYISHHRHELDADFNPYLLHRKHISPILKNPNMTFGQTLKFMLKAKQMRDTTDALLHHVPLWTYETAFESLFLDYKDEYVWYSDEFLTKALCPTNAETAQNYFKAQILPRLKRRAPQIRRAKKVGMDALKLQIVEKVFHPKNVGTWLEAGGWPLLDMMF